MLYKEQIYRDNFNVDTNSFEETIIREYVYDTKQEREKHIKAMAEKGYVMGGPNFNCGSTVEPIWKFYAMFKRTKTMELTEKQRKRVIGAVDDIVLEEPLLPGMDFGTALRMFLEELESRGSQSIDVDEEVARILGDLANGPIKKKKGTAVIKHTVALKDLSDVNMTTIYSETLSRLKNMGL